MHKGPAYLVRDHAQNANEIFPQFSKRERTLYTRRGTFLIRKKSCKRSGYGFPKGTKGSDKNIVLGRRVTSFIKSYNP